MRKLKFVSVFVLLALLLSAGPGAVIAEEPPPQVVGVGDLLGQPIPADDNTVPLWGCGANLGPTPPLSALTPPPPVPDNYENCNWVWVTDQCFPGHMDTNCRYGCTVGCSALISDRPVWLACVAACNAACWVPSYCTGHWEWFCA